MERRRYPSDEQVAPERESRAQHRLRLSRLRCMWAACREIRHCAMGLWTHLRSPCLRESFAGLPRRFRQAGLGATQACKAVKSRCGRRRDYPPMTSRRHLSATARQRIFDAADGLCHICGLSVFGKRWEVEHRIPLALGGADDESNMSPAHKDCHGEKTATDVGMIAKAKRQRLRHSGIRNRSSFPGGRDSRLKRKMDGTVVER